MTFSCQLQRSCSGSQRPKGVNWSRYAFAMLLWFMTITLMTKPVFAQEAYKIGPQDQLRIKVFEWRASVDKIYAWKSINSDYLIGPNGILAMPLIGEIQTRNMQTSQLAKLISTKLQQKMRLAELPDTTIEIIKYRPFYITGIVQKAGEYSYRPNLSVLQAISIAGGILQTLVKNSTGMNTDRIIAKGDIERFRMELVALQAKEARLSAELARTKKLAFPSSLTSRKHDDIVRTLLLRETLAFDTRRKAYQVELGNALKQKSLLSKKIVVESNRKKVQRLQIKILAKQQKKIRRLLKKGYTNAVELLTVERNLIAAKAELLTIENDILQSRIELSKSTRTAREIESNHKLKIVQDLQATTQNISQVFSRLHTAKQQYNQLSVLNPLSSLQDYHLDQYEISYKIVRRRKGRHSEIIASEASILQPGDIIKVLRTKINSNETSEARRRRLLPPLSD